MEFVIPVFLLALVLFGLVLLFKTVRIVPQQTSLIIAVSYTHLRAHET